MTLPEGRAGQMLAVLMATTVGALLWFGAVAPVQDWFAARADRLDQQRALLERMRGLADAVPELRRQAEATRGSAPPPALLEGASDAVAGATLQERVQQMATDTGTALTSVEALPAEAAGKWRRIGVRVAFSAPYPAFLHLLAEVEAASPRMLVDDLSVRAPVVSARPGPAPLDANLTVYAFRKGDAP